VAESTVGDIKVFQGVSADSKAERVEVFAGTLGLRKPFSSFH
jgi:hypothetical protein